MTSGLKRFPLNYPADVLTVIDAMSYNISDVTVVGSMSMRSQQYAADYDMMETVKLSGDSLSGALANAARGLQLIVSTLLRMPDLYIGDIKCGEIPEWKVISGDLKDGKVVGYDAADSRRKLDALAASGVVTASEAATARDLIKDDPSPAEFLEIAKEVRPHVLRWTPREVLQGQLVLRTGRTLSLAAAIHTPSVTKLDVVAMVQNNRFTDFSIIYQYEWRGKAINPVTGNVKDELRKNVLHYMAKGDYFKMAKRIFAIVKQERGNHYVEPLVEMFNGDLGRLYSIVSDIGSMLFLLENQSLVPVSKLQYEIGQFRARLGNVFETDQANTDRILKDIMTLETAGRPQLVRGLTSLDERLRTVLNRNAKKALMEIGLYPVPHKFLP